MIVIRPRMVHVPAMNSERDDSYHLPTKQLHRDTTWLANQIARTHWRNVEKRGYAVILEMHGFDDSRPYAYKPPRLKGMREVTQHDPV